MDKITPIYRNIPGLSAARFVREELPYTQALYHQEEELHKDVAELFEFYIKNAAELPMYSVKEQTADDLLAVLSRYSKMLEAATDKLFQLPFEEVSHWFDCTAVRDPRFRTFYEFARATFMDRGTQGLPSTVYGRVDAAVSPSTGEVLGVYEMNGDTPVMLFESINLENLLVTELGTPHAQANDWWDISIASMSRLAGKAVAVACDVNFIEDTVSSETIAQMFEAAGARVYFTTLEGLNHDLLDLEKPFRVDGVTEAMDAVFMLLPWEEMWMSNSDILPHWKRWAHNVKFFEPPWRWFMSHKGMLAFVTHLLESDASFHADWKDVPHLRAYLSTGQFQKSGTDYVAKPVVGRLSQNITIIRAGAVVEQTGGMYGAEPMVFQEYVAPGQVQGRNNFIVGCWLAAGKGATLCFREFDGAVLDLHNERFIAHQLTA